MIITGVADRVPDRIRRLVYWNAFVPNNGECLNDMVPPQYGLGANCSFRATKRRCARPVVRYRSRQAMSASISIDFACSGATPMAISRATVPSILAVDLRLL